MDKQCEQLYNKGIESLERRRFEEAAKFFKQCIEKCPDNSHCWCALGVTLLRRADQDWDNALIALEVAVEKDPANFYAWVSRGEVLGRKGAYLTALYSFEKGIALTEEIIDSDAGARKMYIEAQNGKAWVLIDGFNEFDKALECCEEVLRLDKNNHLAIQNKEIALKRKALGHPLLVRRLSECPFCKTTIYEISNYCPNCGNKLARQFPPRME